MSMNSVGRPSAPEISIEATSFKSLLGGKGLLQSEKLILKKTITAVLASISPISTSRLTTSMACCART